MAAIDDQFQSWFDGLKGLPQVPLIGGAANANIQAATDKLKAYWASLSPADKATFFAKLQQHDYQSNPQDLVTLATTLPSNPTPAAAATPTSAIFQTTAAPTTTGAAPVTGPAPIGTPYTPGTQYPNAFSYTGAADMASLAALAGQDAATFQKSYDDYVNHVVTINGRRVAYGQPQVQPGDDPIKQFTPQEFAQHSATALQGQWQPALDAMDYEWNAQYGERMPGVLRQQLLAALNGMDQEQQQAVLSAEMTYVTGLTTAKGQAGGIGQQLATLTTALTTAIPQSIGTITTQYAQANPNIPAAQATEIAARKQGFVQWLTDHHVPVTTDLLNQLIALPPGSATSPEPGTDYAMLLNMPSDTKGMSWGQKDIAMGNLSTQWKQYFSREPNQKELLWSIGKTPDQINAFVDSSASAIPGVTIGRYRDYTNFISTLGTSGASATTHAFSGAVDDSVIKDLHQQVTAASTGQAAPGAM